MDHRVGSRLRGTRPSGRARLLLTAVLVLPLLAPATARPQASRRLPTFGAGVEMVNLSLSVTDAREAFVTGLGKGDFAVLEDGVPQELALFTQENLPLTVVLMIDGSGSMAPKRQTAHQAAIRFTGMLRPQDLAQVVEFNERVRVLQPFTSDLAAVDRAIRSTAAEGSTALHTALYVALKDLQRTASPDELRRRAIVVFTDGEDNTSIVDDEQVLELARKCDVAIYPIALRSETRDPDAREFARQAEYLLNTLARDTGGRTFFPAALAELDSAYGRISEELRTLYGVGYASSNAAHDGKWRRIVVKVLGREGLKVRHRLGYRAPVSARRSRLEGPASTSRD